MLRHPPPPLPPSSGQSPPIQDVIDTGCVPRVVEFLRVEDPSLLVLSQLVLWCLALFNVSLLCNHVHVQCTLYVYSSKPSRLV